MRQLPEHIIKHGIEVFGTKEKFEQWLLSKTKYFNFQVVIDQPDQEIDDELGRIEWGIVS